MRYVGLGVVVLVVAFGLALTPLGGVAWKAAALVGVVGLIWLRAKKVSGGPAA